MDEPLNHMGHAFHETAKRKGWWDEDPALIEMRRALTVAIWDQLEAWGVFIGPNDVRRDVIARLISRGIPPQPRNVGELMMLLVSEVAEAFEEYRSGHFDEIYEEGGKPEGGPIEVADLVIRVTEMAAQRGWDLDAAVARKALYNKGREFRHGGKLA